MHLIIMYIMLRSNNYVKIYLFILLLSKYKNRINKYKVPIVN